MFPSNQSDEAKSPLSSQVKLLVTNNAFCIVQRAAARSKTGIFRDFGVAEATPDIQAGWSGCMCFFLSLCSSCPLIWVFLGSFCDHPCLYIHDLYQIYTGFYHIAAISRH
jgi:hypothetical protein